MPIRWYGTGDKADPLYLHFSRIVNLTIHFMAFAALNSGLWFFENLKHHPWPELKWFSGIWLVLLLVHFGFVIAKRPSSRNDSVIEEK